jgi:hypothetical protein
MNAPSDKILELKQLLAERFGHAKQKAEEGYVSDFPALDEIGLPRAALTEIVSSSASGPGGMLLLFGLLRAAAHRGERVIVVDGKDSFEPRGLPQGDMQRLLWTRCRTAKEALQAVDLAARDGNFPLIVFLLTLNPPSELKRIPSTAWHRLQMLVEKSAATLLIFTPFAQVGCARLRLSVGGDFPLTQLHRRRADLVPTLHLQVERRRVERSSSHEAVCRSACA